MKDGPGGPEPKRQGLSKYGRGDNPGGPGGWLLVPWLLFGQQAAACDAES